MTALTTAATNTCSDKPSTSDTMSRSEVFVPSASEDEAKSRFAASVTAGIDVLMRRGMGRDRATRELLNMVANGCSPDEEEVFKVMETRGLSFNDATRVMTVAAAFDIAHNNGGTTEAIDQLTSRLDFSMLTMSAEIRTSSPTSQPSSFNKHSVHISRKDSAGSLSPTALTKKCLRTKDKANRAVTKGKKRAFTETTTQVRSEDANKSSADIEVKEKMLNAKLKAKSPEPKARTKRTSVQQLEEAQPAKRARAATDAASCSTRV